LKHSQLCRRIIKKFDAPTTKQETKTVGLTMSGSNHLQRFIRSRSARIALALALVALSAWAFVPYIAYRIAPSAFVNAELLRVAAPITGQLTQNLPHKGDFVSAPVTLSLITSLAPDQGRLFDLDRELAVSEQRAAMARKQLDEIAAADAGLEKRVGAYRDWSIKVIADEIAEAEAAKASQARLHHLQDELAAVKIGIFLRDGANDAPYSQQQRDRYLLRRQELEIMVLEGEARSQKLVAEITDERARVDHFTHAALTLPEAHVVWSVSASPGSTVTEGQTLLDLADCAHRFVAVELPERDFERIKAGDVAYVRLIGSNDWNEGTVRRVRGSAARGDDRLLAAQVPSPDTSSITVEVGLPADDATADHNNFCNIGRLAEVRFQRGHFALFDKLTRAFDLPAWRLARTAAVTSD
jgi:multidrug resistance efflux pump